ncbi:hypothetical protein JHK86_049447 [Glycine max]|uniref:Uncharacterized protein n=1 Tax=Glycine max TaxID=3847 RepID=K7MQD0_SOYBN|nr:hypothetical protein JHK86_049447 [Glycine max]
MSYLLFLTVKANPFIHSELQISESIKSPQVGFTTSQLTADRSSPSGDGAKEVLRIQEKPIYLLLSHAFLRFMVQYSSVLGIEEPHQSIPNLVVKLYCGHDILGEVLQKNSSALG